MPNQLWVAQIPLWASLSLGGGANPAGKLALLFCTCQTKAPRCWLNCGCRVLNWPPGAGGTIACQGWFSPPGLQIWPNVTFDRCSKQGRQDTLWQSKWQQTVSSENISALVQALNEARGVKPTLAFSKHNNIRLLRDFALNSSRGWPQFPIY